MLPLIWETLSKAFSIGLILSFNLSSDDANAITSPPAFIVLFTPKPPPTINAPVVLDVESVVFEKVVATFVEAPASVTFCRVLLTPAEPLTTPVPPKKLSADTESPNDILEPLNVKFGVSNWRTVISPLPICDEPLNTPSPNLDKNVPLSCDEPETTPSLTVNVISSLPDWLTVNAPPPSNPVSYTHLTLPTKA